MQRIDFNKIKVPINVEKGYSYKVTPEGNFCYEIKRQNVQNNRDNLIQSFLDELYENFKTQNKDIFADIGMDSYYKNYYQKVKNEIFNYFNQRNITVIEGGTLNQALNIICNNMKDTVFILHDMYYRRDTENFMYDLVSGENNNRHCMFIFLSSGMTRFPKVKSYKALFERIIPVSEKIKLGI